MSDVSTVLGNAASPPTFTHNGKTYSLRKLDQAGKSRFEEWLKRRAFSTLAMFREFLGDGEEYQKHKTQLFRNLERGAFSFHRRLAREAMQTTEGGVQLACILFGCDPDELETLAVEKAAELKDLLERVRVESAQKLAESGADTTAQPVEDEDPNVGWLTAS